MKHIKNFNEDLATVHAYLCADGYVCRPNCKKGYSLGFRNTDSVLLKDFQEKFERIFDLKPHFSKDMDRCSISSKEVHNYLLSTFGSFHSYEWTMPTKFLNAKTCASWLRAFFDCEAWVMAQKAKNRSICLDSVNFNGLKEIQKQLLKYYKIPSTIRKRNNRDTSTLGIFGKQYLIKFQQKISFLHEKKRQILHEAIDFFIEYKWEFPKNPAELKGFIIQKMKDKRF